MGLASGFHPSFQIRSLAGPPAFVDKAFGRQQRAPLSWDIADDCLSQHLWKRNYSLHFSFCLLLLPSSSSTLLSFSHCSLRSFNNLHFPLPAQPTFPTLVQVDTPYRTHCPFNDTLSIHSPRQDLCSLGSAEPRGQYQPSAAGRCSMASAGLFPEWPRDFS